MKKTGLPLIAIACAEQAFFSSLGDNVCCSLVSLFANCLKMPGATVKDVPADKFVTAFADYLKRTGKVRTVVPMLSTCWRVL